MPDPALTSDPVLTTDQVRKVAKLSRLALTDDQVERFRTSLSSVLGYVDRLRALDLTNVEPMAHAADATNRLDPDTPGPTLPNSTLMAMAPDKLEPFLKVPKIIDDGTSA